jgi:hypothetical protein
MSDTGQDENYLELFDVSKNAAVDRVPLANISPMPRTGERIFLPLQQPRNWIAYTVVAVECFLATRHVSPVASGLVRITLYAEPSQ